MVVVDFDAAALARHCRAQPDPLTQLAVQHAEEMADGLGLGFDRQAQLLRSDVAALAAHTAAEIRPRVDATLQRFAQMLRPRAMTVLERIAFPTVRAQNHHRSASATSNTAASSSGAFVSPSVAAASLLSRVDESSAALDALRAEIFNTREELESERAAAAEDEVRRRALRRQRQLRLQQLEAEQAQLRDELAAEREHLTRARDAAATLAGELRSELKRDTEASLALRGLLLRAQKFMRDEQQGGLALKLDKMRDVVVAVITGQVEDSNDNDRPAVSPLPSMESLAERVEQLRLALDETVPATDPLLLFSTASNADAVIGDLADEFVETEAVGGGGGALNVYRERRGQCDGSVLLTPPMPEAFVSRPPPQQQHQPQRAPAATRHSRRSAPATPTPSPAERRSPLRPPPGLFEVQTAQLDESMRSLRASAQSLMKPVV